MKNTTSSQMKSTRFIPLFVLSLLVSGILPLMQLPTAQAQEYSDLSAAVNQGSAISASSIWSAPVNLGSAINSTASDQQPAISPDGLSLYFTSNRVTGSLGGFDMYVSQRATVGDPWGSPLNLGPAVNTTFDEGNAAFSRDGRLMFFQSKRPTGSFGGIDIWVAQRNNPHDDFDWQPAVNLGPAINSTADDQSPYYFEDNVRGTRQLYFSSGRPGLGGNDIYVSEQMADGSFGPATLVTELSSTLNESDPAIRHDGLEVFFHSNRAGSTGTALDLWVATRGSTLDAWSTPVNLGSSINTAAAEQNAYLSSDGMTLFFASDRPGGSGGLDLYMSTRTAPSPSWSITGSLNIGRQFHTATLLPNGKVLVAGGNDGNFTFNSAELYDPATGTWTRTGNLNTARDSHTATLLKNGKVLVAGGFSCGPPPLVCLQLNNAELYDPAAGTWSRTDNLNTARDSHTATLLPNGKVLVAGGFRNGAELNTAELYDPATGTWSMIGNLNTGRYRHTATLLQNGKVLVVGGRNGIGALNSAELYDPAIGMSSLSNLNTARELHTATLLSNGKVLVAGGFVNFDLGQVTKSVELYDPATGIWSSTGNLITDRAYHTATLLFGGKVLVAGGFNLVNGLPNITNRAELYDAATGTWSETATLNIHRRFHTATLLLNGRVLGAGGTFGDKTAELYNPGPNQIDDAQFFVRQHYLDFLNREPDAGGLSYWTNEITKCGTDARCLHERRIGVSMAFFIELEFQDTGYYVYRFYKASFGRQPNFAEFTSDRSKVIGGSNLEANKQAFADEWVHRAAFTQAYPTTMSNTEFVNKLFEMAGLTASIYNSQRQQEIQVMNAGRSRALILRDVIEIPDFKNIPDPNNLRYAELKQISQYNPAFVLMQYFGYLKRNVDQGGYDFWLDIVNNRAPNNYRGMVCSFITSTEYQVRFGSVTRSNADCGQ